MFFKKLSKKNILIVDLVLLLDKELLFPIKMICKKLTWIIRILNKLYTVYICNYLKKFLTGNFKDFLILNIRRQSDSTFLTVLYMFWLYKTFIALTFLIRIWHSTGVHEGIYSIFITHFMFWQHKRQKHYDTLYLWQKSYV